MMRLEWVMFIWVSVSMSLCFICFHVSWESSGGIQKYNLGWKLACEPGSGVESMGALSMCLGGKCRTCILLVCLRGL